MMTWIRSETIALDACIVVVEYDAKFIPLQVRFMCHNVLNHLVHTESLTYKMCCLGDTCSIQVLLFMQVLCPVYYPRNFQGFEPFCWFYWGVFQMTWRKSQSMHENIHKDRSVVDSIIVSRRAFSVVLIVCFIQQQDVHVEDRLSSSTICLWKKAFYSDFVKKNCL